MNRVRTKVLNLVLVLISHACGSSSSQTVYSTYDDEIQIVQLRTGAGEYESRSVDAEQLFQRGTRYLKQGQCQKAIPYFERLISDFVASRYLTAALFNAGLCQEKLGNHQVAAQRFESLLERSPDEIDRKHAQLHLVALYLRVKENKRALNLAEEVLSAMDIEKSERVELMAQRARALFRLQQYSTAERQARAVLSYYEAHRSELEGQSVYFVAAANFILAEILRLRTGLVTLNADTKASQGQLLKQRIEQLLEAQREYLDTIRWASPYWAVASGYEIGAMYESLWQDLEAAPMPKDVPASAHTAYREELRTLVQPLVRHAIRYWELTLRIIENSGVKGEWTRRTRSDLKRVREFWDLPD